MICACDFTKNNSEPENGSLLTMLDTRNER